MEFFQEKCHAEWLTELSAMDTSVRPPHQLRLLLLLLTMLLLILLPCPWPAPYSCSHLSLLHLTMHDRL